MCDWTCDNCGNLEVSNFAPKECDRCGGTKWTMVGCDEDFDEDEDRENFQDAWEQYKYETYER